MVRRTVEDFGRLDYAFNNAGVEGGLFPLDQYTEARWHRTLAVNLTGVWLCMKYEIPEMLKAGGGAIVNAASAAGVIGVPNHYAYVASKHGVIGITKSAALEFGARGIRVNCVCPGIIDTPMTERFVPGGGAAPCWRKGTPSSGSARPGRSSSAVVWLCSDAASFVRPCDARRRRNNSPIDKGRGRDRGSGFRPNVARPGNADRGDVP